MSPATYQLTDNDLLYYLHIPKTAGTSFRDILKAHFKPEEASFAEFIGDLLSRPPQVLANLKVISGHHFYNLTNFTHPNQKPVYITMLRDPVERTISYYAHIRRSPVHNAYDLVKEQSLLEFVTDPRTRHLYANSQTRYLAADPNTPEMAKSLKPNPQKPFALFGEMELFAPTGFDDPALLTLAQKRLQDFTFVGVAEQFDEAVELLCYTFGWPVPPAPKVLNVSPNRPKHEDTPQEVIDIIRQNTQLDEVLYETGKQLFSTRYQQMLKEHPEKINPLVSGEDKSVADLQREISFQKRLIDTLQEEKLTLEGKVRDLQVAVERREKSFGWQLILRFNKMRLKLIPRGSKREEVYLKIRGH